MTFPSLSRRDYQFPQCKSICQVRNIFFQDQTKSFFLQFGQGILNFEETQEPIQLVIGDPYCPIRPNYKGVYLSTNKTSSF